jgi:hypothetical protein
MMENDETCLEIQIDIQIIEYMILLEDALLPEWEKSLKSNLCPMCYGMCLFKNCFARSCKLPLDVQ